MKKIIQIILIVLIVATIIFIAWLLITRKFFTPPNSLKSSLLEEDDNVALENTNYIKALRRIQETPRRLIYKDPASNLLLVASSGEDDNLALFTTINPAEENEKELAISPLFRSLHRVSFFAPDRISLELSTGVNKGFYIFSASSSSWLELEGDISSIALSPDGSQFAIFTNGLGLEVFDYQTQSPSLSIPLKLLDFDLYWPAPESILLISKPSYKNHGYLIELNPITKTVNLITEGDGLMASFDKSLENILVLKNSDTASEGSLEIIKKDGSSLTLGFITLPIKCSFTNAQTLYCAVPQNNSLGLNYPDSYLQKEVYTQDNFFKITLSQGFVNTKTIFDAVSLDLEIDVQALEFINNKLYFINRYDNQLYELSLE